MVFALCCGLPLQAQQLTVDAGPDKVTDIGLPVQIGGSPTAGGGVPPYVYSWSPAAGLDDPTAANPFATVNAEMTYRVTVTDAEGATASDETTVRVRVWLYAISDSRPNQVIRVDIFSTAPDVEIMADEITYGGPSMPGLPPVGSVLNETEAAALDPVSGKAYIISNMTTSSALMELDLLTGVATGIGFIGVQDINALAWNPISQTLYGLSSQQSRMYRIDRQTADATALPLPVATTGSNIEGLAFDHFQPQPVLYGIDESSGVIYTIDTQTGEGTAVGSTITGFESIEFASDGRMFAAHNLGRLYLLDRENGFAAEEYVEGLFFDGEGLLLDDGLVTLDDLIPVELLSFSARSTELGVLLTWVTATESENLGFHIYRREQGESEEQRMNEMLIQGAGNSSSEVRYEWRDTAVRPGRSYTYWLEDVDFQGRRTRHGPVQVSVAQQPEEFMLLQSYPNPFSVGRSGSREGTRIAFMLTRRTFLTVRIFSLTGREVTTLARGEYPPGRFSVFWDGRDRKGHDVPGGIYFYSMETTGGVHLRKKLLLIR